MVRPRLMNSGVCRQHRHHHGARQLHGPASCPAVLAVLRSTGLARTTDSFKGKVETVLPTAHQPIGKPEESGLLSWSGSSGHRGPTVHPVDGDVRGDAQSVSRILLDGWIKQIRHDRLGFHACDAVVP